VRDEFNKRLGHELALFGVGSHHVDEAVEGKHSPQLGHCKQPADGVEPPETWQTVIPHGGQ